MNEHRSHWRRDPVAFITEVLVNPETGKPFELYPAEVEFIRRAFTLNPDGRLPFLEALFVRQRRAARPRSRPCVAIYVAVVIGGLFAEVYCLSNDYDQSVGRVFQAAARIIQASPLLAGSAKITADRILFTSDRSEYHGGRQRLFRASRALIHRWSFLMNCGLTRRSDHAACGMNQPSRQRGR